MNEAHEDLSVRRDCDSLEFSKAKARALHTPIPALASLATVE